MKRLRALAEALGAAVAGDREEVRVEAPPFHRWLSGGVHELVCFGVTDAAERMAVGLERCPDGRDCDWCNDNRELRVVR